ncbi:MAG: hypothetical protein AB4911_08955 [Oscillochloridaceae bacterium umkhey_bin13]
MLALLPVLALPALRLLGGTLPTALQIALLVCFPVAGFAALLRQDLLRIDVALQRTLGYALTSGGLLALTQVNRRKSRKMVALATRSPQAGCSHCTSA